MKYEVQSKGCKAKAAVVRGQGLSKTKDRASSLWPSCCITDYLPEAKISCRKAAHSATSSTTNQIITMISQGNVKTCDHCFTTSTPCWRRGPAEKPCLCNACGTRWCTRHSLVGYLPTARPTKGSSSAASQLSTKPATNKMKKTTGARSKRAKQAPRYGHSCCIDTQVRLHRSLLRPSVRRPKSQEVPAENQHQHQQHTGNNPFNYPTSHESSSFIGVMMIYGALPNKVYYPRHPGQVRGTHYTPSAACWALSFCAC